MSRSSNNFNVFTLSLEPVKKWREGSYLVYSWFPAVTTLSANANTILHTMSTHRYTQLLSPLWAIFVSFSPSRQHFMFYVLFFWSYLVERGHLNPKCGGSSNLSVFRGRLNWCWPFYALSSHPDLCVGGRITFGMLILMQMLLLAEWLTSFILCVLAASHLLRGLGESLKLFCGTCT